VTSAVPSASLTWLLLLQVWVLMVWLAYRSSRTNPFRQRLDHLLALLLPQVEKAPRGTIAALTQDMLRAFRRRGGGELRSSTRRWRAQLEGVYEYGYRVASESISPSADCMHERGLVQATVEALKLERGKSGAPVAAGEDSIVVLAYGLGAWPPGADLTSLEQLLEHLGVSHETLRSRFESFLDTFSPADQSREFRELAGASFVLGAAARIVEGAEPVANVRPLVGSQRSRNVGDPGKT